MSVLALVSAIAGFIKIRYLQDKAVIDNVLFRIHYRMTTGLFFLGSLMVTASNLIGDPINCMNDGGVPEHVINTYCWISTTFTMPGYYGRDIGTEISHPGVGPLKRNDEKVFHSYYQWVPFMLFFQGLLFYLPHYIWKNWEEGKIRMLTEGVRGTVIGANKDERKERRKLLVLYICDTLHTHNLYAFAYFVCELLNFLNVFLNMAILDSFLGGAFMTYGIRVVEFVSMNQENRSDPMIEVFPRVTKCIFQKYGPTGTIQIHDSLCVLALNVINEKIYVFLWFWLIALSILSTFSLLYSFAVIFIKRIREIILLRRFRYGPPSGVTALINKTQVGDFLLLHLIGQNMNMLCFGELLEDLSNKLNLVRNPNPNNVPTAPCTLELHPTLYSTERQKSHKETEA